MKRIGLLLIILILVVIGVFVSRSNGDDNNPAKEVADPSPQSGSGESSPPSQAALGEFRPSIALPPASALFVRIDVRKPSEKTPFGDLQEIVMGRHFERGLDDFLRNVPAPLGNLFVESGRIFQKPVYAALLDRPKSGDKSPVPWVLCGEIGDATRSVTKFLENSLAPVVAGPDAPEVKEDFRGVKLTGRGGPAGGVFWLFSQGEFLACPQKEILQELLGKYSEVKRPGPGESGPLPACERIDYPTGEGSLSIFLDLKKATTAGLLPPEANPNLPIVVSGLVMAQRSGFGAASLVYTTGQRGGRVRIRLHGSKPLSPAWRTINLGAEFFDWVPEDASVAIGSALPGPVPAESSEAIVASASSPVEAAVEDLLPDHAPLVKKVFAKTGEMILIGAGPVSDPDGPREYFALLPYPGKAALASLLDWIRQSDGGVETFDEGGTEAYWIDLSAHPVFGGSELSRLAIAPMGERLAGATHPAMLLRFDPATPFKAVSETGAYRRIEDSSQGSAIFRAYLAAEFLTRLLAAQTEESVERYGLPAEVAFLAGDIAGWLGPLFVSVCAGEWDLSINLASPSEITPPVSLFVLYNLATAFLTEPRT